MLTRLEKYKVAELLAEDMLSDIIGSDIGYYEYKTLPLYMTMNYQYNEIYIPNLSKLLKKELIRCL